MDATTRPRLDDDLFPQAPPAEWLRALLARHRKSQLKLAKASGFSVDHLRRYLHEKIELGPNASTRLRHGLAVLGLPTSPEEEVRDAAAS